MMIRVYRISEGIKEIIAVCGNQLEAAEVIEKDKALPGNETCEYGWDREVADV